MPRGSGPRRGWGLLRGRRHQHVPRLRSKVS